ncbi:MAG: glycoside hydrolase family 15 protein [Acidobacteriaceae bacterium]
MPFATSIPAIQDYAAIGDCRSVALVSHRGSVDWLCWPRLDSGSIFAAIVDRFRGGHWSIAPQGPFRSEQHYIPGSNVLQTLFASSDGRATLTDLMPVCGEDYKRTAVVPDRQLLRELQCTDGEIAFQMDFRPRPDYARRPVSVEPKGLLGLRIPLGRGVGWLRSNGPLRAEPDGATAQIHLRRGDSLQWSLTYTEEAPAVLPPLGAEAHAAIDRSVQWWRGWLTGSQYRGPYRNEVERSLLALKLLAFSPSGAIAAAATTSLPERIHGSLNWDYRFCWLRDASLTVRALLGLGYVDEVESFVSWLLHSTRLTQPKLRVLYDLYGRMAPRESVLEHLEGYRGSRPVRLGNGARDQFQLDTYGEVVEATAQFAEHQGHLDRAAQKALIGFGKYVAEHWDQPDRGMWESRSGGKNHTHSRLMCWTALDRLLRLEKKGLLRGIPSQEFLLQRERIRHQIERRAWNPALRSYAKTLDGEKVDSSLLRIPWHGFERADSARMQATGRRIMERLRAGEGLLFRYKREPEEGAFGACGFWAVEYLAMGGGTLEEAHALFQDQLRFAGPVGLLSEEVDPETGDALGNLPQAFTHVGLISAALALEEQERRRLERHGEQSAGGFRESAA